MPLVKRETGSKRQHVLHAVNLTNKVGGEHAFLHVKHKSVREMPVIFVLTPTWKSSLVKLHFQTVPVLLRINSAYKPDERALLK